MRRMLTVKQPVIHYGYKSVHDLPTPPSTSRTSPPLVKQETAPRQPSAILRSISPPGGQPMSTSHRGLPPPAAMALAHPPPPPGGGGAGGPAAAAGPLHHPPAGPQQLGQAPPPPHAHPHTLQQLPPQQSHPLGQLPAPPNWQQPQQGGPDDAMRAWLLAKAEEEKRRQEEEKTRQESLRLEQRRMEHDMLRISLQGGIPPSMVAIVFASLGSNTLPPDAMDIARQFVLSNLQGAPQQQALAATAAPVSPDQRRELFVGGYATSTGVPSTPGSAQAPHAPFVPHPQHPGSPATRQRGYSIPGSRPPMPGGPSNLPNIQTGIAQGGGEGGERGASVSAQASGAVEPRSDVTFHHWIPPPSLASGSSAGQPATPSGESPRKRKATGPQPAAPPPSAQQRLRSPPFQTQGPGSTLANPPPGRRRGHSRQRSDLSQYRPTGRGNGGGGGRQEQFGGASGSPTHASAPPTAREGDMSSELARHHHQQQQQQQPQQTMQQTAQSRSGPHSVSSLLSEEPSPRAAAAPRHYSSAAPGRSQQQQRGGEGEQRRRSPDDGGVATRGGAMPRERDDE